MIYNDHLELITVRNISWKFLTSLSDDAFQYWNWEYPAWLYDIFTILFLQFKQWDLCKLYHNITYLYSLYRCQGQYKLYYNCSYSNNTSFVNNWSSEVYLKHKIFFKKWASRGWYLFITKKINWIRLFLYMYIKLLEWWTDFFVDTVYVEIFAWY